ncbi:competence type IV pilus ATPase ComGA [Lederbergia galactosidilytica]|uniref:Competence protein ComG n=1 Tax=Lederbergia galactosidilytica TaxID=217031 RepID=A0A178A5F7_9BACI|nr:competence type IV pilus ATPase ComGA [Lederbergia galactosidilytica]OAK75341.1 competence protein ComG [Lederbergia galactosidilytica]
MSIEKIAESLVSQALYYQATDIHVVPRSTDYLVQFRIHGILTSHKKIPIQMGERIISHLKFLASMDIGEKRKPQSGSLQSYFSGILTSLRISTLPTAKAKESIVIRILHHKKILSQQKLSLFPNSMRMLQSFMKQAHGLVLFTGPTGSGKSTSMFTLADYCSKQLNRRVISLEDPVEQQNDHFVQVQVNEKAGMSFHNGLKAVLRHDPDVILIGEIRDAETAFIAIRAAMTGHLVLSTMHTRDAKGALYRFLEFGVKHHDLQQTLLAITSQRLVKLRCPFCGFECSKYCIRSQTMKRTGIYELLHGQFLQAAIEELKGGDIISLSLSLPKLIAKGVALGYISEVEYEKWIVDEKNIDKRSRTVFY